MADANASPINEPLLTMPLSGWPVPSLYPFSFRDVVEVLGQLGLVLMSVLTFWRTPVAANAGSAPAAGSSLTSVPSSGKGPAYGAPALGTTFHFRFLHIAAFLVLLPVIAASRLSPRHRHERNKQSVFVETNHAVLTALGFAFMA